MMAEWASEFFQYLFILCAS